MGGGSKTDRGEGQDCNQLSASRYVCRSELRQLYYYCCWLSLNPPVEGAYEAAGKRTYTPMILMAASLLLVLVGLVALYHRLGSRQKPKENGDSVSEGTKLIANGSSHSTK